MADFDPLRNTLLTFHILVTRDLTAFELARVKFAVEKIAGVQSVDDIQGGGGQVDIACTLVATGPGQLTVSRSLIVDLKKSVAQAVAGVAPDTSPNPGSTSTAVPSDTRIGDTAADVIKDAGTTTLNDLGTVAGSTVKALKPISIALAVGLVAVLGIILIVKYGKHR